MKRDKWFKMEEHRDVKWYKANNVESTEITNKLIHVFLMNQKAALDSFSRRH